MNPVLAQGAGLVRYGWILGLTTAVFMACFIGWTWWAYSRRNRARLEEAARMPLEDEP